MVFEVLKKYVCKNLPKKLFQKIIPHFEFSPSFHPISKCRYYEAYFCMKIISQLIAPGLEYIK